MTFGALAGIEGLEAERDAWCTTRLVLKAERAHLLRHSTRDVAVGVDDDEGGAVDRLLTVGQAAELLGTSDRFPRRLITERRIRFVHVGRHVRIPEAALQEFIADGVVEAVGTRGGLGLR